MHRVVLALAAVCLEFQVLFDGMHVGANGEDVQKIVHRLAGGSVIEPPISSLLCEPAAVSLATRVSH